MFIWACLEIHLTLPLTYNNTNEDIHKRRKKVANRPPNQTRLEPNDSNKSKTTSAVCLQDFSLDKTYHHQLCRWPILMYLNENPGFCLKTPIPIRLNRFLRRKPFLCRVIAAATVAAFVFDLFICFICFLFFLFFSTNVRFREILCCCFSINF